MANQVLAPPYTPGFGRRPPVVAGRDALIDDMARVLEAGPEHPRFCRASSAAGVPARRSSWT